MFFCISNIQIFNQQIRNLSGFYKLFEHAINAYPLKLNGRAVVIVSVIGEADRLSIIT